MGSERLLSRTAGNQWLGVSPLPTAIPCPVPSIAPELRWPGTHRSVPAAPARAGRMDTLRLPGSGRGRLGASDMGIGQVRGRQEPPLLRGPWRAQERPGRGQPPAFVPVASRGKPRRGGGRRGGQCQAGGLAFRCPLLGAGRPRSLGVPRLTAAASRQLLLPALLPAPAPGRCALAFSTEHLDWG